MSITRNWTGLGYNGDINDPNNWSSSQDINGNICYYGDTWGDTLVIGDYSGTHSNNYLDIDIYGQLSIPVKKFEVQKEFKGNIGYFGSPIVINLTGTYSPPSEEYITNCSGSILQINDFKTFVNSSQESIEYFGSSDFDFVANSPMWISALSGDEQINNIYKYYLSYVDIDIGNPLLSDSGDGGGGGTTTTFTSSSSSSNSSSNPPNNNRVVYLKVVDSVGNGYLNCQNREIKSLNFVSIKGLGSGVLSSGSIWNTSFNLEGDIFYLNTGKYAGSLSVNNCEVFHIRHETGHAQWHPTQSNYVSRFQLKLRGSVFSNQPVSDSDPYDPYGSNCLLNQIIESNNELTVNGYSVGSILGTNKTNLILSNYLPNHFDTVEICGHLKNFELNGYNHTCYLGSRQINGLLGTENQIKIDSAHLNSKYYSTPESTLEPWLVPGGLLIYTKSTIDSLVIEKSLCWDFQLQGFPIGSINREYETNIGNLLMSGGGLNLNFDSAYPTGLNATKLEFGENIQENGIKLMKYISLSNYTNGNGQYWIIGNSLSQFDEWTNYHRGTITT